MRFARLSLERYGRFENCELDFRAGSPDLHVIYGANEAGKTTSLAAVSDLLFGFPTRSPYNFIFDYSLLRVGASLEDGPRTLVCRRKKGSAGTLLDADDTVIDEAPLLAMLKGQTRDTFGLAFSLDQEALRSGGKAMVEARNDVGRALFAAGSGLTGVANKLKDLERESDAIWAPTAAARRSFTQAHRDLQEHSRTVRDTALKPKTWLDAKAASGDAEAALKRARGERDGVLIQLGAAERLRRLAPLMTQRQEQLTALVSYEATVELGKQREDAAEIVIQEADAAERAKAIALRLRDEAEERISKVAAAPATLAEADEIDELVSGSGAIEKATRELVGVRTDHDAADRLVNRLRHEAGANADAAPPRALAASLRDLSQSYSERAALLGQIAESEQDLDERRNRALQKLEAPEDETAIAAVEDALETARGLGADVDARCDATKRKASYALESCSQALARLTPWAGSIDALRAIPRVPSSEIDDVRADMLDAAAEVRRETEQMQRSADDAAAKALEIEGLSSGGVVSPETISEAQQDRQKRWAPLRDHILTGAKLGAPEVAVSEYESGVAVVDEKMELRFTLADASTRLAILEQDRAASALLSTQGKARADAAQRRYDNILERWKQRLVAVGLPALDPTSFRAWQAEREATEQVHRDRDALVSDAGQLAERRDAAGLTLMTALAGATVYAPGQLLAPLVAAGERRRREDGEATQQRRLARSELDQVASERVSLERRKARLEGEIRGIADDWSVALSGAGLVLDLMTAGPVLDLIDELREANATEVRLRQRIETIGREALDHSTRINAVADRIGVAAAETPVRLRALRELLGEARSAARLLEELEAERDRRGGEMDEQDAKLEAAAAALAPLLAETGAADRAALASAIEASRERRRLVEKLRETEHLIIAGGDGLGLEVLVTAASEHIPDLIAGQVATLNSTLAQLNADVDGAATAHGEAKRAFASLDTGDASAAGAATAAEQARAELEVLAEHYILKRAQAVTLKWAIEQYRERHQDPLLLRAGELFSMLTVERYMTLRVDTDGASPRLLGLRNDGRTMVEVGAMSEGTTDQLFLALRLAALEQSVVAGTNLPFLADDLFVNFDDERAVAGFKVLAEIARSTQILFFTHHPHLAALARQVVGAEFHSECSL